MQYWRIIAACLFLLHIGCANRNVSSNDLVAVTGKLYIDGQPASGASIKFFSLVLGDSPNQRGSGALVASDGSFRASTYDKEDGMPPGIYALCVFWLEIPEGGGMMQDRLNGKFMNLSHPVKTFELTSLGADLGEIRLETSRSE